MPAIVRVIIGAYQRHEESPGAVALRPIPEDVRQRVSQLVDNAMTYEGADLRATIYSGRNGPGHSGH